MTQPFRLAFAGCGNQARRHVAYFSSRHDVEIMVFDVDRSRAAALAADAHVATVNDLDDALARSCDALMVCTPTSSHFPLVHKALSAGVHVFCEKPLCRTRDEAVTLVERARAQQCVLQVGYLYRFVPAFVWLHRVIHEHRNPLGKLHTARFHIGGRAPRAWMYQCAFGGGAVYEKLVHMLDLAHWLWGGLADTELVHAKNEHSEYICDGQTIQSDVEDDVLVRGTTSTGVSLALHADMTSETFSQWVEIHGENGRFLASITPDIDSSVELHHPRYDMPAGKTSFAWEPQLYALQMYLFLSRVRGAMSGERDIPVHDMNALLNVADSVEMIQRDVHMVLTGNEDQQKREGMDRYGKISCSGTRDVW
ncbi:Gfo/Idh/MocA family protein [Desulfovibrio inopinatus]|uniref:Gfo/Idh/MocA family protein n=1 Tax=Desulfovibrio inopinatus TaxID=102109 RepID=UPI00041516FD|nr:Gfo/Idh/MocA family oxidoreductase [Desulfovibrio inopinatus]